MVLLLIAPLCYAQTIFSHEREIENKDKYVFSEIDFYNQSDNLKLSGTLIAPKSNFEKVIIILPGSGKDTRNSHYKLSEEFLKKGIAVMPNGKRLQLFQSPLVQLLLLLE